MTRVNRALGVVLAVAAVAALVWASHFGMTSHASPDAVLRLAWSARPERIETCRQQTVEELARLPPHMRQPVVCEGAAAHYRLVVRHAGRVAADHLVRAGGLREDRRLYVFEELALPAGEADIEVRFDRVEPDTPRPAGSAPRATDASRRQSGETVPPSLAFTERLRFSPRAVMLVTYDPQRRTLVAVRDVRVGNGE